MRDFEEFREYKKRKKQQKREERKAGFRCSHCRVWVGDTPFMGTKHRNHCYLCLWSKHVDEFKTGDRLSTCFSGMEPIGLSSKTENGKKYGELMVIHKCKGCEKISKNRIAGDDNVDTVLEVFEKSIQLSEDEKKEIESRGIRLLNEDDRNEVYIQLYGK